MTYRKGLHRFALFTACSTLLLIVAGGLVTSTGSGLSVPDWPNTYGRFMFAYPLDEMVGGIFYEHSHRMIASVVGFLTLLLAVWVWRREERRSVRILAAAALAAVIVQGVLGGITVLFLLPTPVSVAHATLAQTFFAAVAAIALLTSRWWISGGDPADARPPDGRGSEDGAGPGGLFGLAVAATTMVWVQLVAGAVMRHTGSGLVVPDFPLAWDGLLPSLSPEAVEGYTRALIDRDIRIAADGPITGSQVTIHLIHRYWGILTAAILLWTGHRLFHGSPRGSRFRTLGLAIALLTVAQVALGVLTVLMRRPVDVATAHVALGALLLAVSTLAALHCARFRAPEPDAAGLRAGEAAA